ncbi:MAG: NUDIX hydrolase [Anaerolineae bacterium]|nr:NUDIX hydrolase [Anaerolineae bacterium]NUQ03008.1 NUDIX hydrolase [Anaerolineae bacterium]
MTAPNWLNWAQRLESIAQTGLHYEPQPFDRDRYEMVRQIAAEMLAAADAGSVDMLTALLGEGRGHATPKIDVRGVIVRGDRILLVQEMLDHGRWTLPGGWADVGESAGESVAREIYEETGYQARAVKLLALFDRNKHDHPPYVFHAYKAFFRCELLSDERTPDPRNIETGDVGWFSADALPELSTARVTYAQIARFFEHLRRPDLSTDFD